MCEMSEKGPQGLGGENLQFFRFFEKFAKMKKSSQFDIRTTKI